MRVSGCCADGYGKIFSKRQARRDARRYRRKGLDRNARRMVDELTARGVDGASVLEVGGGVGAIELELLTAGAARATNVELSPEYEEEARRLVLERGAAERVERRVADFVAAEREIPEADVVVMHRVVCCYPDPDALVGAAARRARRLLAMTFPRDTWWMRLGQRVMNVFLRRLYGFEAYVHPRRTIVGAAERAGFSRVHEHSALIWQIVVLERAA